MRNEHSIEGAKHVTTRSFVYLAWLPVANTNFFDSQLSFFNSEKFTLLVIFYRGLFLFKLWFFTFLLLKLFLGFWHLPLGF